ncbi:tyrosine-type recombinase/integrase [Aerococcaceae bacterium DSM 111176]|nr:tyrosine-type recombinase/integrase [Aerococcaceae bacterium DSM 111176]
MHEIEPIEAIQVKALSKQQPSAQAFSIYINHELVNVFLKETQTQSKDTMRTYKTAIRQFVNFIGKENSQPRYDDVLSFIDHLKQEQKAPSTIQTYTVAVRLFFKWAENRRLYPNIARDAKGAKVNTKAHKGAYLTADEAQAVLKSIDTETLAGLRNYAMIALMLTAGLRTIEVSGAKVKDIATLGNAKVLYIQRKGHQEKDSYIKIASVVYEAIMIYLKERNIKDTNEPLFASLSNNNKGGHLTTRTIRGIVKQSFKDAGLTNEALSAHSTRHTSATLNLLNGGTLEETQQLLGHANIETTMIYAHHLERMKNNSEERISDAIFK